MGCNSDINESGDVFDAHIRLIFSRQYHINCLSIQNTYNFIYAYIFDIWPSVSH